ncbi:MAG TPA: flagellar basal body P-ring protein FlgI [Ramlibacter sp.]|uniref:flagellar basal body P-ring protein FlgI n=1 Tax=Ramlibacter sp. TaxID=1917967 RepID=UPI002C420350|nr:flagellar basal body P-ring protein FlgI [Ramlibacter sp.]HVZ46127.1 flagellar basal body P-ring protein FlgI [Ramlibacter sp.]
MKKLCCFVLAAAAFACQTSPAAPASPDEADAPVRVKDLGKLQGWRENSLVGWGIVTGLAGTGDSPSNRATRQALSNVLAQFNLTVPPEQVQSRNVAVVTIAASLPAFAREGDNLDVTVNSAGDARSLVGGTLMLTPLKAANGRVYALAQGPLAVGGYRYDANGNVIQKNHPTVGSIPGGAVVEVGVKSEPLAPGQPLMFVLEEGDYTTASRVASAINAQLGAGTAHAKDASGIEVAVPESQREQLVSYVARIENVLVHPDRRAKVVINERTGTVVAGGDVTISRVAISHGDLKISITSDTMVSQPAVFARTSDGVRTAVVTNSRVDVDEREGNGFLRSGTTVADLVQSLARLKTQTRDIISILRAVKAAGALHAELVVQ